MDEQRLPGGRARKMRALRALAERPGTPEEGLVARQMLAKLEALGEHQDKPGKERSIWEDFAGYCRREMSTDEFLDAMERWERKNRAKPLPTHWPCPCGKFYLLGRKCLNFKGHAKAQAAIQKRFKKGQRVFYNRWAYPLNSPAKVCGYVRPHAENGTYPWAWIILKFDHLNSNRAVPILSEKGYHLSEQPMNESDAKFLAEP